MRKMRAGRWDRSLEGLRGLHDESKEQLENYLDDGHLVVGSHWGAVVHQGNELRRLWSRQNRDLLTVRRIRDTVNEQAFQRHRYIHGAEPETGLELLRRTNELWSPVYAHDQNLGPQVSHDTAYLRAANEKRKREDEELPLTRSRHAQYLERKRRQ